MPSHSEKQRRKMNVLIDEGKIPESHRKEWDKIVPSKKKKKNK